jgi:1,4-dihydroxy-2-naphthoate octaprenyltransferase
MIPAIPGIRRVVANNKGETLNKVLADTGKVLFLYAVLFSLGWIAG